MATVICCATTNTRSQIEAGNQRVRAMEDIRAQLANQYQAEGHTVIQQASTPEEAQTLLVGVRQRWAHLWGTCDMVAIDTTHHCHDGAWPTLVAAQQAWAAALEQSAGTTVVQQAGETLRQAYCGVEMAIPSGITAPPAVHVACNERP